MKVFIAVLVLTLSFQSWTKADDIRDLEIEGMSIGDSALKYFKKSELINDKTYYYKRKYAGVMSHAEYKLYDTMSIDIDLDTKNYTIVGLSGDIDFKDNIEDCYKLKKKIVSDFENMFPNIVPRSFNNTHDVDPTGKSTAEATEFIFKSGDSIMIYCMDWSDELTDKNRWWDGLKIYLATKEFNDFINYEAYN